MKFKMTEIELKFLKENCRAEAAEFLIKAIFSALENAGLDVRKLLLDSGNLMRKQSAEMTFRNLPPEYSDMYAAEYQEAVNSLLARLENRLLP